MADNDQVVIIPAPPRADETYSLGYMNQLNRWLENLARVFFGIHYGRFNGIYLAAYPTSGYGLKPGEVFANDGILTVVREDDIWAGGFAVSADLGTVTVTIS